MTGARRCSPADEPRGAAPRVATPYVATPYVELARGLVAIDPTSAARLLLKIPASQRDAAWIEVARAVLLRPIARELQCGGGAPRAIASVGHALLASIDDGGRASLCDLAAERVAPLAQDAVCARVLDRDHVGVLASTGELTVFDRRIGWQPRPPIPLDPPAGDPPSPGSSRCERDLAIPGPGALAVRRGGGWQLVDLDAAAAIGTVDAAALLGISRDRRRALVGDARGNLAMALLGGPPAPAAPPLAASSRFAFDPDSGVAVAVYGGAAAALDVDRGAVLRRDRVPPTMSSYEVAPGGRLAVGLSWRGALWWWPLGPGAAAPWLESVSEAPIQRVAFNRAGTRLAWLDSFGRVGVRDVGSARRHELPLRGRVIDHITFVTDDRLAAVTRDGRVLAWDLDEQRAFVAGRHELAHCQPNCKDASPRIWSATVDPTGSIAVTAGWDGTVGVWPLGERAREAARLSIGPGRRSFLAALDGDLLIVTNHDAVAQIWNWRTRDLVAELPGHEYWGYAVTVAHPAPEITTLVTGSRGGNGTGPGTVRFWRRDGSLIAAQAVGPNVIDLASSPSGRLVAAALNNGDVVIYDAALGQPRARVAAHQGWARRVVFLDDESLVSAGDDGVVQQISISAGARAAAITRSISAHSGPIYDLALRGSSLLTASHDRSVRLWELRDGSLVRTYDGHRNPVNVVRWHRDGTRFVSGDSDIVESADAGGSACVWRVDQGTCQDWLIGHRLDIRAAQFIDDERVMTASFDGTVRVWTPLPRAMAADELADELLRRAPAHLDER